MFEKHRIFKTVYAGRELTVETGKTCELSNGSCWVKYGETVVMANVTASPKPREGVDFFPLSVDYEERLYSVGRIPGSFMKREGKPSEKSILTLFKATTGFDFFDLYIFVKFLTLNIKTPYCLLN